MSGGCKARRRKTTQTLSRGPPVTPEIELRPWLKVGQWRGKTDTGSENQPAASRAARTVRGISGGIEATADAARTGSLPEPPRNAPSRGCARTPYASRTPPRGRGGRSARRISAGVERAPWSIQPSPRRLPKPSAPAACPNRRGTRPRLAAQEFFTEAARRFAGVPAAVSARRGSSACAAGEFWLT